MKSTHIYFVVPHQEPGVLVPVILYYKDGWSDITALPEGITVTSLQKMVQQEAVTLLGRVFGKSIVFAWSSHMDRPEPLGTLGRWKKQLSDILPHGGTAVVLGHGVDIANWSGVPTTHLDQK